MRLWHKDLIPVLPRQQLLAQWQECCCIAKDIAEHDTPNHILVNKIMDYPLYDFIHYATLICREMEDRHYEVEWKRFIKYFPLYIGFVPYWTREDVFKDWHNDRYLRQCYYNLQEKYDCGGITEDEWKRIEEVAHF